MMPISIRLVLLGLIVTLATSTNAQDTTSDSLRISGEKVVRRVSPGGVRIYSRRNNRPRIVLRTPAQQSAAPANAAASGAVREVIVPQPADGISRADLDRVAAAIIRAIEANRPHVTVVSPPGQVTQPLVPEPRIVRDTVYVYLPGVTDTIRVAEESEPPSRRIPIRPPTNTVEEIERAFLDTGLFRSILVNFEFGRSTLLPTSYLTLASVAEVMKAYPDVRIQVSGHTDSIGSDEYNLRLSEARARSVLDYLVSTQGISRSRLAAVGHGERKPIASNGSPTGRTLNRRVEFVVLNPETAVREQRRIRPN